MSDEIKEILDRAKKLKYKCDCCEEILPGKYVMKDDKQTDNLIEAVYIIDRLLDYITNLQQELDTTNEKWQKDKQFYNCRLEENVKLRKEIDNLQQENERLKKKLNCKEILKQGMPDDTEFVILTKANYDRQQKDIELELIDYKSRVEKAVEYINKFESIKSIL